MEETMNCNLLGAGLSQIPKEALPGKGGSKVNLCILVEWEWG